MSAVITIDSIQEKVCETTFEAKKNSLITQYQIDEFLDSIIDLKNFLKEGNGKLNEMIEMA